MKSSKIILTFHQDGQKQNSFELAAGVPSVLTIGSQSGSVDVAFSSDAVSRVHAQVTWDGEGGCKVVDNNSTNGTWVNGKKLPVGLPTHLQLGDTIDFGGSKARMRLESAGDGVQTAAPEPSRRVENKSLLAMLAQKPELSIGRQADCDIVIDSTLASRLHAKLRKLPDGRIFLIDLDSTNGTFINGQRIQGNVQVQTGDKIIIGRSVLSLDSGAHNLSGEIAIRTESIQKVFKNGQVGLQASSLSIPAGSLVAIMGPSGCGKSTLLKCLTGEAPATHGKVYLHNLELIQNYPFLKTLIGYVPQDDIVHKELTVEQSLYFAARLRMERPTRLEIDRKIEDVLQRLRIAHIRHSPIAKISGGQRKRVSIAVELLTDPLILFLDEPTSPLDPQTIDEFLKILQELARKGTTVIMVTHKPEDLEYMDSVIFLAEGGSMVYDGAADSYKRYFEVRTAVEVYANISGPPAQKWIGRYRAQHHLPPATTTVANPRLMKRSDKGVLVQAFWLSRRYMRIKTNDLLNIAILIGQAPIIAALICMIFDQVTRSVPFMITLSAIWFGTSNAAREIVAEAAIYRRERMFNLRIGSYIASKLAVLSFFAAVQALLFSGIIALGFQHTDPAWNNLGGTIGWVWLMTICATMLGLMISSLVDTSEKAMTIVPLVLIPQVMLAGVVAKINQAPVEILSYFTPTRWGNEGLMLIQKTVDDERLSLLFSTDGSNIPVSSKTVLQDQFPSTYTKTFGDLAYTVGLDTLMIGLLTGAMFCVLFLAMRRKDPL